MSVSLPVGVKYARVINIVTMVWNVVVAVLLLMIFTPNFIRGAETAGGKANIPVLIISAVFIFALLLVPAALLFILNKALLRLKETARIWQIVASCIFLLGFPLGTILYGIGLYFMLFDEATKKAFTSREEVATPAE